VLIGAGKVKSLLFERTQVLLTVQLTANVTSMAVYREFVASTSQNKVRVPVTDLQCDTLTVPKFAFTSDY